MLFIIGLAEKTGRGIDRIFEGSLIYGRSLPDYSNTTAPTVSLFIPRSKPDVQLARMIADEQNRLGRPLPINTLFALNILKDIPRSLVRIRSVVQICLSAPKGSESSLIRNLLHNFEEYAQREKLIQIEKGQTTYTGSLAFYYCISSGTLCRGAGNASDSCSMISSGRG